MSFLRSFSLFNRTMFSARMFHTVSTMNKKGVVLGTYRAENSENDFKFTVDGEKYCDSNLIQRILSSGPVLKKGQCRLLTPITSNDSTPFVALVGLGHKEHSASDGSKSEGRNLASDHVRVAVAAGVAALRQAGVNSAKIDACDGSARAAAEAAELSQWGYDELKSKKLPPILATQPLTDGDQEEFDVGSIMAKGQNLARTLMETPANIMTPHAFAKKATDIMLSSAVSTVTTRNREWACQKGMGAFLSVANGSHTEPVFLEIEYNGKKDSSIQSNSQPIVLVGKGVTFDSGGISLKPSKDMDQMRGDMGGAACVLGAMRAIADLGLNVHVVGLIPLCENMPGGKATKPGDVVTAMNGKTIQIDNTDAEGRLILADALCYASSQFNPRVIIDIATLTGAIAVALGSAASGVYTCSEKLWPQLEAAGTITGDRMWRMPLWKTYASKIKESKLADVNNVTNTRYAGSCTAAAFLREFVGCKDWFHIDIAGVMEHASVKDMAYLGSNTGMSGRPTRTIIEFIKSLA